MTTPTWPKCVKCGTADASCHATTPAGRMTLCYNCCCDTTTIAPCRQIDVLGAPRPDEVERVRRQLDAIVHQLRGDRGYVTANEWLYLCAHVLGVIIGITGSTDRVMTLLRGLVEREVTRP